MTEEERAHGRRVLPASLTYFCSKLCSVASRAMDYLAAAESNSHLLARVVRVTVEVEAHVAGTVVMGAVVATDSQCQHR